MVAMNSEIVRRSYSIMDYPYGRNASNQETAMTRSGVGGWLVGMGYAVFDRRLLDATWRAAARPDFCACRTEFEFLDDARA